MLSISYLISIDSKCMINNNFFFILDEHLAKLSGCENVYCSIISNLMYMVGACRVNQFMSIAVREAAKKSFFSVRATKGGGGGGKAWALKKKNFVLNCCQSRCFLTSLLQYLAKNIAPLVKNVVENIFVRIRFRLFEDFRP